MKKNFFTGGQLNNNNFNMDDIIGKASEVQVATPVFDTSYLNSSKDIFQEITKNKAKLNQAQLYTAEAAKEQVEYLKDISVKYEQIVEQNKNQAIETSLTKIWTIVGVIIMAITLIATIVVPIIIYYLSKGGA